MPVVVSPRHIGYRLKVIGQTQPPVFPTGKVSFRQVTK